MTAVESIRTSIARSPALRRWISRAFIVSVILYLVVLGYLVAEAVMGASKWAPYGVNIPTFVALIIASEVIITVTAVLIFRDDAGIWPDAVAEGWASLRGGAILKGAKQLALGAWDTSVIDLRLRTPYAIFLGRLNRVSALVPLVYALVASAGGAPWGLRTSALFDIVLTLGVWAFMELVMVRRDTVKIPPEYAATPPANGRAADTAPPELTYEVRPITANDIERIERLERIIWKGQAATAEMIRSRMEVYPEGQLAAVHVRRADGQPSRRSVEAWTTTMPANEARVRSFASWDEVTSNGTLRDCDRDGEVIVGVNLTSVAEGASYFLIGDVLAKILARGQNKLICGSRLNGFVAFNERRNRDGKAALTPDQYARLREVRGYRLNEERLDQGLAALSDAGYVACVDALRLEGGLEPLGPDDTPDYVCSNLRGYMSIPGTRLVDVIPDYFLDPASDNYGVLLEWTNPIPRPLRAIPWINRLAAGRVRNEVHGEWARRKERLRERRERRSLERVPEYLRKERAGEPVSAEEAATTSDAPRR